MDKTSKQQTNFNTHKNQPKQAKQTKIDYFVTTSSNKPNKEIKSFKYNQKRDELVSRLETKVEKGELNKATLDLIISLFDNNIKCVICKQSIPAEGETSNCKKCHAFLHIKCLNSTCKEKKKKQVLTCLGCKQESNYTNEERSYNCYCKRYYEEQNSTYFDPELIDHGCGSPCDEIICVHKNCNLPCHPGPHEICTLTVVMRCPCGKQKEEYKCGLEQKIQPCGQICNKIMDCNSHFCELRCHEGRCICTACAVKPKQAQTTAISLKGKIKEYGPSLEKANNIVYCGRRVSGGWNLKHSIWGNPFKLKDYNNNLDLVLENFEKYARRTPRIMDNLHLLVGKRLACWCKPAGCHTDILIKLMKEKNLID